jgi:thiol-disulfide isomerase/thioredoxin
MRFLLICAALICIRLAAQSNWPAQLDADVKAGSWEAAARVGAAIVEEIEMGRMFDRFADVPKEVQIRRLYADALDRTGASAKAAEQRAIAALLVEHPDSPKVAAETNRRFVSLKLDLLATEVREPSSFPRDEKVQVVSFWAAWCAPCKKELDELSRYRNPRAKVVVLDFDRVDRAVRERYVKLTSLEAPELPQLYVIDANGVIRFHQTGFDDDGFFAKKLDWMIEAALK